MCEIDLSDLKEIWEVWKNNINKINVDWKEFKKNGKFKYKRINPYLNNPPVFIKSFKIQRESGVLYIPTANSILYIGINNYLSNDEGYEKEYNDLKNNFNSYLNAFSNYFNNKHYKVSSYFTSIFINASNFKNNTYNNNKIFVEIFPFWSRNINKSIKDMVIDWIELFSISKNLKDLDSNNWFKKVFELNHSLLLCLILSTSEICIVSYPNKRNMEVVDKIAYYIENILKKNGKDKKIYLYDKKNTIFYYEKKCGTKWCLFKLTK
ncbi:hypothetical protein [Marinitoga sp. 1155]|uniref:hypothetical protein n=1 Tax=Marinitoga sp. 1155 TaxID=1428448 RepID=UPI00064106F6|nr:hypothetical protein [Marinitoga sp. 1155]AMS33996.1 hypothetical protein UF09_54 [Marinitoga camini virus 2]KLO24783.1 hypothetical protein X274_02165 [Marinitoga sp. 1155]